jgi:TonB family protein
METIMISMSRFLKKILSILVLAGCATHPVGPVPAPEASPHQEWKRTHEPCTSLEECGKTIHAVVANRWRRPFAPQGAKREARLRVHVLPSGHVQSIQIEQSSGDERFDRSAERAVWWSSPFDELRGLQDTANKSAIVIPIVFRDGDE